MQLIRTHFVFGLLRDLSFFIRRQQFRRDRRVHDVQKNRPQLFVKQVLRRILHQIAYKRLRDTGIQTVHRHLVAAIRGPAQCQFAQIACSYHDTVHLVRHIHQHKRPDTRLRVLIRNIAAINVVLDILQVLDSHVANRYLPMRDTQQLHHIQSVMIRTVTRAEARHGDTHHLRTVIAKLVSRKHADQKCQRTVQTTGHTYHHRLGMRVFPTTHQRTRLDREHIHAITVLFAFLRQERRRRERTMHRLRELFFTLYRRHIDMTIVACLVLRKIRIALSVSPQALDIYLLNHHRVATQEPFAFLQHLAILSDIRAAREHHVGCRFAYAGRSVDIPAMHTCRLLGDHLPTKSVLAHKTVTAREVENQLCTLYRQLRGRRKRTPQVLAYLHTKRIVSRREQQIRSKRHFSAPYLYLRNTRSDTSGCELARRTTAGKPTFLIELTRVRQVHFRHYAHHFTVGDDKRTVE